MRISLFLLTIFVVAVVAAAPRAEAQSYPWCAFYNAGEGGGGGTNCGFTSFEQCMETVRGMGGFCERNTQYATPATRPARPRHAY